MRAVVYTLTLCEPLLATSLQGDPNSSVSLNYVAGGLVRGALIQHYIRTKNLASFDEDSDAQRLFINGSTRYLHAYPATKNGDKRVLPAPRSLLRRKSEAVGDDEAVELLNDSHATSKQQRARFEQSDTLKPLGAPFCTVSGETLYTYQPERTIAIHIKRHPVKGRSVRTALPDPNDQLEADGAVFRYDALAPEQQFQGVVLAAHDEDAGTIQSLLETLGTCWLGRSRSAHYGKTTIDQVAIVENWREHSTDEFELGTDNGSSMTLLSDTILYTPDGHPVVVLDDKTLSTYLGAPVTIVHERSFSATNEVSGFNRHWKLPLPQEYALAAGSVICFTPALSGERMAAVEQQGIGARRAEGFGRIGSNWCHALTYQAYKRTLAKAPPASGVLQTPAKTLAKRMTRQVYEQRVEQKILEFIQSNNLAQRPESSQLGRLRVLVRQALPTGDVEFVQTRFADFKAAARQQYERARIGNQPFDEWITTLLQEPSRVWTQFNDFRPPVIAGQQAPLDDRRVALQLLAAILAASTREGRAQGEPQ